MRGLGEPFKSSFTRHSFFGIKTHKSLQNQRRTEDRGGATLRTYRSGPLQMAEIECRGYEGPGSLSEERCRACVLEQLGPVSPVDQVSLRRACKRVYCSGELSKLARTLAVLKQLVFDRASYAASAPGDCCEAWARPPQMLAENLNIE